MAKVGLSKPHYAIYTVTNGVIGYSDGGIMGKATSANAEINTSENNSLYADNAIAETEVRFAGGTLTLSTDDLSQEVSAAILGVAPKALEEITGITDTGVKELVFDDSQTAPYLGCWIYCQAYCGRSDQMARDCLHKDYFLHPAGRCDDAGGKH